MIELLLRSRYVVGSVVLALLAYLIVFGEHVGYEQSISSFFAEDDPAMLVYQDAAGTFGDDNFVFLVYDDPEVVSAAGVDRVAELAAAVAPEAIPGVLRIESLDAMPLVWALDDALLALDKLPGFARKMAMDAARRAVGNIDLKANAMTVGGAVRAGDAARRAAIRERLIKNPLFVGTLIDSTATTTAVVARLRKTSDHDVIETVRLLREKADAFAARHGIARPAVVGPPVLLADGFASIEIDGRRLAAVGMILIALVTLSAVRSIWWAIVPILAGWTVWLATETLLHAFGVRLSLSGGPLVAQIIVLTMPAASHLAIHFRDDRRKHPAPTAARLTLRRVWTPIFWTAVTGAVGYLALVTSDVMPIRQFGAILGACTLTAAVLVMALSPIAMLPPFPLEIPVREGSRSRVSGAMNRLTLLVHRRPAYVVAAIALATIPPAFGMFRLTYETNYINLFKPQTRVVRDYQAVESKLGGIGLVEIVAPIESDLDPEVLAKLDRVGDAIADLEPDRPGAVAQVLSLATVLDPDGRIAELAPDARARVLADKLELIAASPQASLLQSFWNPEAKRARILVRLLEQQPAATKASIFRRAEDAARAEFGPGSFLTGLSYLMTKTTEGVVATQWGTFAWSAFGILAMLTLAFRSPTLAVLALLPTLLSVALVLGLMGWLSIKLDIATALVASVALGLSVDDTFHCLIQYHKLRRTRGFRRSLFASYSVSGPGVLLSSLAVAVGFLALRTSEFEPFVNFGTMVAVATAGSTLGNLLLLPACLTLFERRRRLPPGRTTPPAPASLAAAKRPGLPFRRPSERG
ncbi:efflux RND transporter permease subunit [Planctomyces sp. SH-PL62]|uniref:efflux RND transporter permease subunit n=1 Tax=Planctomyces sp. SH-PL62 TaxID=1636152 RepID=UPI00078C0389|nr:MMPL family transporter [Planctomyces sp. SH-PL62]AMV38302.1 MMPL family protein [Planctomyces sp. SH-PL62]